MKKKLASLGLSAAVVLSSVSAYAATYIPNTTLTGKSSQSGNYSLGDGVRYLNAKGLAGNGTVSVKKIVPYAPDSTVASDSLKTEGTGSTRFNSVSQNSKGVGQSYYIKWDGSSNTAKVSANIKDEADYK